MSFLKFPKLLHSGHLLLLKIHEQTKKPSDADFPSLLCGWAVNEQITQSLTGAWPHSRNESLCCSGSELELLHTYGFHTAADWLCDSKTRLSLATHKSSNHPFSIPVSAALKVALGCCCSLSQLCLVACRITTCNKQPHSYSHTPRKKLEFPIRLTCTHWTVGQSLSTWKKSTQEEQTDCSLKEPGPENRTRNCEKIPSLFHSNLDAGLLAGEGELRNIF